MNIFVLDECPVISAQMQCDKHIVKMPLETAQMLCSVWHRYGQGMNVPYKEAHKNHPCTLWAGDTMDNYNWLWLHGMELCFEYTRRYNKIHGAIKHFQALWEGKKFVPDWKNFITPHPQCFSGHDDLKTDENFPIEAYRKFYIVDKSRFARYKYTNKPQWMTGEVA